DWYDRDSDCFPMVSPSHSKRSPRAASGDVEVVLPVGVLRSAGDYDGRTARLARSLPTLPSYECAAHPDGSVHICRSLVGSAFLAQLVSGGSGFGRRQVSGLGGASHPVPAGIAGVSSVSCLGP